MEITIDCGLIEDRTGFHETVAKALNFPAWYGGNLDALHDCLTDIHTETRIRFQNWEALENRLGSYAAGAKKAILQATSANPHVAVTFL